jgi:hypothetical protein
MFQFKDVTNDLELSNSKNKFDTERINKLSEKELILEEENDKLVEVILKKNNEINKILNNF